MKLKILTSFSNNFLPNAEGALGDLSRWLLEREWDSTFTESKPHVLVVFADFVQLFKTAYLGKL